jgi:hypothetical protein
LTGACASASVSDREPTYRFDQVAPTLGTASSVRGDSQTYQYVRRVERLARSIPIRSQVKLTSQIVVRGRSEVWTGASIFHHGRNRPQSGEFRTSLLVQMNGGIAGAVLDH